MRLWIVIAVAVTAFVLLVACVTKAILARVRRRRAKKAVLQTCELLAHDTIFVTLVSDRAPLAAARTMHSLIHNATCPLRVHIGLYELYGEHDTESAVEQYKALVEQSPGTAFPLLDNIRVIRIPAAQGKGMLAAREHAERYLYCGQTYALSVAAGSVMAPAWDTTCIDTLHGLPAAVSRTAVLTTIPGALGEDDREGAVPREAPATFVATTGVQAVAGYGLPMLAAFNMKRKVAGCVPAVAFSAALAFSRGARITEVPWPPGAPYCDHIQDLWMTCALAQAGWTTWHPPQPLAMTLPATQEAGPHRTDDVPPAHPGASEKREAAERSLLARMNATDALSRACATMGVNPHQHTVSARGRLGLTPVSSALEREAKLGSKTEYLSLLSQAELAAA